MWDFSIFAESSAWAALITLTAMEIVLGIDNIVFISILTDKLPADDKPKARSIGMAMALLSRLALLFAISWVMGLTEPLFTVFGEELSGRDLILFGGGLFLIAKATHEMFDLVEGGEGGSDIHTHPGKKAASFTSTVLQIMVLDIVFSLDSVITAVGMAKHLLTMVIAMVIAVIVMLIFVNSISEFISRRPSMKVLALSFLVLIGVMLVAESLGQHINKGYIYFAMGFSLLVELLNVTMRNKPPAGTKPKGETGTESSTESSTEAAK